MLKGFKEFIMKGNVVDMAVGVVVGVAFNNVVNSLVKNIVTPLIGAFGHQSQSIFYWRIYQHPYFFFHHLCHSLFWDRSSHQQINQKNIS
jgi:large-conductance mechanosensitive channel